MNEPRGNAGVEDGEQLDFVLARMRLDELGNRLSNLEKGWKTILAFKAVYLLARI